jgi:hypothetical protein
LFLNKLISALIPLRGFPFSNLVYSSSVGSKKILLFYEFGNPDEAINKAEPILLHWEFIDYKY